MRTLRILLLEKNGSGDFTIIQDAIDTSAQGDTVRVGPGRYDTFRQYTNTIVGPEQEVLEIDYVVAQTLTARTSDP